MRFSVHEPHDQSLRSDGQDHGSPNPEFSVSCHVLLGVAKMKAVPILLSMLVACSVVAGSTAFGDHILHPGSSLEPGRYLRSRNGLYDFMFQRDGNLVVYRRSDKHVVWSSGTAGKVARELVMHEDGNCVLYKQHRKDAQWSTKTNGIPATSRACGSRAAGTT